MEGIIIKIDIFFNFALGSGSGRSAKVNAHDYINMVCTTSMLLL
jgi:hypothetical protein